MALIYNPYSILNSIPGAGRVLGTIDRIAGLKTLFESAIPTAEQIYLRQLATQLVHMRFAQGWQWAIAIDGFPNIDMFAKDVTYPIASVEVEEKNIGSGFINKPIRRNSGTITMVVRDTIDGEVLNWVAGAISRVTNEDGTVNLPAAYLQTIRMFHIVNGALIPESVHHVIPTEIGEITRARDQLTEFHSFPVTFTKYTSFNGLVGGI
ncbi:phage tail protein [Enterobacter kobei]|uniref:phage tail protein n=1 Tax=Enterobacter kobei TaxID=208224 RepID=UPI0021C1E735|nr:phage tail protein [Enterobacter kobei]UXJ66764.1 phage tail protein [Enterobacter kobei]HCR0386814.1 phage tail protein [Enterobacter kobei]